MKQVDDKLRAWGNARKKDLESGREPLAQRIEEGLAQSPRPAPRKASRHFYYLAAAATILILFGVLARLQTPQPTPTNPPPQRVVQVFEFDCDVEMDYGIEAQAELVPVTRYRSLTGQRLMLAGGE